MSNSKMPFAYTIRGSATNCLSGAQFTKYEGSVCRSCYAKRLEAFRPRLKEFNERAEQGIFSSSWVAKHLLGLDAFRASGGEYVRVFDFGDFVSHKHAQSISQIAYLFYGLKFWIPTKMLQYIPTLDLLDNTAYRLSHPFINGTFNSNYKGLTSSVVDKHNKKPIDGFVCPGSCEKHNCRACWDKSIKNIIYKKH